MPKYSLIAVYLLFITVFGTVARCKMFSSEIDDIWPIPQRDGTIRWMTRQQAAMEALRTEPVVLGSTNSSKVRFFLYTQSNPTKPVELDMDDPDTFVRSTFSPTNPTRIMIHGWTDVYDRDMNKLIREALLLNGKEREFNFISVDWSVYSATINYIVAKNDCSKAGAAVAKFIDWMHENVQLSFDTLTLYGHSLGAHVAGFAGKKVQRGRISAIIGLDPAMPLFRYKNPRTRLAATDARYVESIQTNGGLLGFFKPIGQIAFYPNGGRLQPGCPDNLNGMCSHIRAVELLSESLKLENRNQLFAKGCDELQDIEDGSCNQYSAEVRLGDPSNANRTKGIYYLETNSKFPFAIGRRAES